MDNKPEAEETQDENEGLNEKQEMAIELVANGMTDLEVARKVKVSRQTVSKWKNQNFMFKMGLEARRKELIDNRRVILDELVIKSIAILKKNLESKNPKIQLQVALQVMKLTSRMGIGAAETDEEFAKRDRKYTIAIMCEALEENRLADQKASGGGKILGLTNKKLNP